MRRATLKQLRAFAAVARTGSVTAAAQSLNVSPPAITLQMRLLQDQVAVPLIERSPRGMVPTQAGRLLIETVRRVEAALGDCAAAVAEMAGSKGGTVHVGVVSTAKYVAPRMLAAFAQSHPGVELRLFVGNRADVVQRLAEHEIDLAMMGSPPESLDVSASVIGEHPHVIVARPDHQLSARRAVPASALAGETFLVREPGSGTRTLMERFFAERGIAPRIGMEIGSNETVKQAVIAGLGIAFLSAHTVNLEVQAHHLTVIDVEGLPIVRQWYVVRLSERRLMPVADKLAQFFVDQARLHLPRLRRAG